MIIVNKQRNPIRIISLSVILLLCILTLLLHTNNLNADKIENELAIKQSYDPSKFLNANYNENLTRIFFELFVVIIPDDNDVSFTAHFTYQNSEITPINSIVHVIDITTILIDSRVSSIDAFDTEGNLFLQLVCTCSPC